MRNIIGPVLGLYLTVTLVVFGGAAWHFMADSGGKALTCAAPADLKVQASFDSTLAGGPDWLSWAGYRAIAWPKTYFDDQEKAGGVIEWLLVEYNPFPQACR